MNTARKTVFWFSSQNWRNRIDIHQTEASQSPEFLFYQITDYRHNWENIFMNPNDWVHAAAVITEPVLLMMNDPEYKESLFRLFRTFVRNTIEHSVLMQNDTYDGILHIFSTNYYTKYLYRKLYDLHQSAFYQTFRCVSFNKSGNLSFQEFMSYYLVILVSQFHDHGYMSYAMDIMERTQAFFDAQEKELISSPISRLAYNYKSDPAMEGEKILLNRIRDYDLPYEHLTAVDSDARGWKDLRDWKDVKEYLSRYGNNRDTSESRKKLLQTLDDKLFHTLLSLFGLEISGDGKFSYMVKTQKIVQEIKTIEGLNVVPYDSDADFQSYVDSYLGESRHIVFHNYILHDKLYADELDRFLSMFQEYMAKIRKIDIKFEKEQTERGTLYTIKSYSPELVRNNFSGYAEDFYQLMDDIFQQSDDQIGAIISKYHLPPENAEALIQKYKRELNRIMIDAKYNCLSKISTFYRNLEEEANNESTVIRNARALELQADLPSFVFHPSLPGNDEAFRDFMNGDPNYDKANKTVEEIIKKYADSGRKEELLNALNTVSDPGLSDDVRKKEKQKLARFLKRISHLIGDIDLDPQWTSSKTPKTLAVSYTKDSPHVSFLYAYPPKSLVGKALVIEGDPYRVVFVTSDQREATLEKPVPATGSGIVRIIELRSGFSGSDMNGFDEQDELPF